MTGASKRAFASIRSLSPDTLQALRQALSEHWDKPQRLQQLHETAILSVRGWLSAIAA
jgi:hypothetical protein